MTRASNIVAVLAFLLAGALAFATAVAGAAWIEARSVDVVQEELSANDIAWVEMYPDGLQLAMTGTAPSEAERFRALTIAGSVVDSGRLIDAMDVVDPDSLAPPRFSLEILRNASGISLIGLVPTDGGRDAITRGLAGLAQSSNITDLVETADHTVPATWNDALGFAMQALQDLPRSKISVMADQVQIIAVSDSPEQKRTLEVRLRRNRPDGVDLTLDISAPRPVVTPFTLRFNIQGDTASFDACTADTEVAREKILDAAAAAGFADKAACVVGLGVPSGSWADAVALGIAALKDIGGGTLTFSDADVTLIAQDTTPQATFDRVIGELESALPEVFSLHSVLPPKIEIDGTGADAQTLEFVATRSPEGLVQMRGRLTDTTQEAAVLSFARAHFGTSNTYIATRQDPELPDGWSTRVLAGLESLSFLENGTLIVHPDVVELRGDTGSASAESDIARMLAAKLGENANYKIDITYQETLDPLLNIPTPEECVARLNDVLAVKKITFAPGSADIDADAAGQLDQLAAALEDCDNLTIEIGGHTDSQGREEMNASLSLQRARAVRQALIGRGVRPSTLTAEGYGESQPIADNDTEDGREANRRIAFVLVTTPPAAQETPNE